MIKIFTHLLLFSALLLAHATKAQSINGETNIVPGESYSYSCSGFYCGSPSYYWNVTGGTITTDDGNGNITVAWNCTTSSHQLDVYVYGEEYDREYGYSYQVGCGSASLSNFTVWPPTEGTIYLYNYSYFGYLASNQVCPNQPFTLDYVGSTGVQQINWLRWDGANWQTAGTSYAPTLAKDFPGITASTTFKAQPIGCGGTALAEQTIVIQAMDVTLAGGIAVGSRDVFLGSNEGVITLADCQGAVLNWQRSTDGGGTWLDMPDNTEQMAFSNLTVTTLFRAKSYLLPCQTTVYSQSCTIRVDDGGGSLSWTETKTYNQTTNPVSNSRTYFDQTGRAVQSQAKSLTTGKILATQPLFNKYDQPVGSTLAAPINDAEFAFNPRFVTPTSSSTLAYDYNHFDGTALNSPVPVGNSSPGTLGWYYSANNTIEPQTPITSYPYSRTEEAADGSTGVGRASGVGEVFRMGQNKENVQGNFPVRSELNNYAQLKNQYFPVSVAGGQLTTFKDIATQQVSINSNGQKAVSFQDKEGHTLMTARPGRTGDWLSVSNAVEIGWPHSFYKSANQLYENPVFEATSDIKVYDENFNLIFSGSARDFSSQLSSRATSCRIYSNDPFQIVTGRILNASTGAPISWNSMYVLPSAKREAYAFFNFYTFEAGKTTVTGLTATSDYVVTNSITGADVTTGFKNGTPIPAGFYQIRIIQGAVTLAYANDYQDIAYAFYNQKGQLLGSLAPNGVKKLLRIDAAVTTGPASSSLSSGLVTWLPFDEQAGATAADASGKGSNASLNGSSWAWKPTDGVNNGALELTGTNYLKVPIAWQSSTFPTGSFTVSWWTKPYQRFAYNQMIATDCGCWGGFMFHTDWNGEVYVGTDLSNRIALGANTLELNVWQQFTFTFTGSTGEGRLYKNGQLLSSKGMSAPTAWQYLTLGTGGSNSSEGLLDEFRVYNRALSDADAKELYQTKLPFFTSYEYNTLGQLTALNETDAGRTEYVYRKDGQIRFSQNAKQRANNAISYTGYDTFGRPVESGECAISGSFFADAQAGLYVVENMDYGGSGLPGYYMRSNIVRTTYDVANPVSVYGAPATGEHGVSGYSQYFLAGRVATVTKFSSGSPYSTYTRTSQTWFSYDEQGRNKWVIRQQFNQAPHTLDYEYDFNNNVVWVCYQKNNPATRFTHYYSYDPDQRLSEVRTNTADPTLTASPPVNAKLQASYSYYLHGPLKRVVVGELQGVDYLYTAQGWLKSINGVQSGNDPGMDGYYAARPLPDLFSQELEYYAGDYYSARRPQGSFTSTGTHPERFDGTIRAQVWRTPSRPTAINGYGYRYNERSQLSQADYGFLTPGTGGNTSFSSTGNYQEGNLTYDPNGNLGDLRRTDRIGNNLMNIKYEYTNNTNKLARVYNPSTPTTPTISYTYDALGQLASQVETGKDKYFDYDVSGKVTDVYRAPGKATSDLVAHYDYDEFGQRIRQVVYDSKQVPTTTQYVRDAAGNEVASYYLTQTSSVPTLAEQPIYGASRVGVMRQPRDQEPGAELYELNDQLGNTRVVFQAPRTDTYLLTMENGRTDEEQKQFATPDATTYNSVRQSEYARQNSPNLATTAPYTPHYAMRLSSQVGPGKKLAIAPGDQVRLEVWVAYPSTPGGVITGVVAKPVTQGLLGGATLLTQPQTRRAEAPGTRSLPPWQQLLSQVSVGVAIPLGTRSSKTAAYTASTPLTAPPNAVLRYTLRLVRDRSLVDQGTAQVPAAAEGKWQPLNLTVNVNIEEPAELEVWVQNLDAQYVYFDDLKIEHQVGALVAENHFYPYGQRNDALSWTRPSVRSYGRGYQGQNTRFDEETGYDNFELRLYDSRIGRWLSTDPMGQYHSPYVGMGNDPVNGIDPDGGWLFGWFGSSSAERQTDRALNLANSAPNSYLISEKNYVSTQNINYLLGVGWSDGDGAYSRQNFRDPFSGSLDHDVAMYDGTWDPLSNQRIEKLDPRIQGAAINFINSVQEVYGIKLRVDQGLRTIAEQNALYAKGRTSPGGIVTKVRGGFSAHNYGLAIDVVPTVNGHVKWAGAEPILSKISHLGKQNGFEWGGDWNPHHKKGGFVDLPHFQMHWSNKYSKPQ